jgi:hypothetical protein
VTHQVCISQTAGDRATGYTMSTKMLRLPRGLLLTWIDSDRQNRWALVHPSTAKVEAEGVIGSPRADNHCGAALARTGNTVHAILGAHHDAFDHYSMDLNTDSDWRHVACLPDHATYPSVVAGSEGRLHLAYRCEAERFTLNTRRYDGKHWSAPYTLVTADKPGYIYWTNGIAKAPDGTLHLVFGNTRVLKNGDLQHSASHVCSTDEGTTWNNDGVGKVGEGISVRDLPLLTPEDDPDRVQTKANFCAEPGPGHSNYLQILLSNPVVDSTGRLHVVLHNGLNGTADLMTRFPGGEWSSRLLNPLLTGQAKGRRIHLQSSLGLGAGDELHIALMIRPDGVQDCHWGPNGTFTVRWILSDDGSTRMESTTLPDAERASWLPALEHPVLSPLTNFPAMLYTNGLNAGGFSQNRNRIDTRLMLDLQSTDSGN